MYVGADAEVTRAHTELGGLIIRCSVMDYRAAQLIARWFTPKTKIKFLSNVMHTLASDERRQILEHRIAPRHHAPDRLRALAAEYAEIMRRRDVATHGILFKPHGGPYEFRSFAATRTISDGEVDTLTIDELGEWSQRAVRATEQFVSLAEPRGRATETPAA